MLGKEKCVKMLKNRCSGEGVGVQVFCGGVSITMQFQVLISFCGLLCICLSPAGESQKDHLTCSVGPPLEWASTISRVTTIHRYETWGDLHSKVQAWSKFSKTLFQFSSFSSFFVTQLFRWLKNDEAGTTPVGCVAYQAQNLFFFFFPSQKTLSASIFLKTELLHYKRKINVEVVIQIPVWYLVVNTLWSFWKLFCSNKRIRYYDKKQKLWIHLCCISDLLWNQQFVSTTWIFIIPSYFLGTFKNLQ